MTTTGTKYQSGMDTAQAAKFIRADIKKAQAVGELPASMVVSVRISRFSGGSAIDISIKSAPVQIHASDFVAHHVKTKGMQHWDGDRYTAQARALLAKVEAIGDEYRRTDSDLQSDYYNTNFYLHAKFSAEMEREDMEILTAYHDALAAPRLRLVG